MTFLNNNLSNTAASTTTTTVLPDFQYLTSPSGDKLLSTTATPNHIPIYPIPKSADVNQYGNNIANLHSNAAHVSSRGASLI